jgi:hypothetical protein
MQNAITELEQITLTSSAKNFLRETAKWAKFLSIAGFIALALMLMGSFFISAFYHTLPQADLIPFDLGIVVTLIYIVVALIYIFPVYYLYQFSAKMKEALISKDDAVLVTAFEMLKSHYKFIGVSTIITLSIYVLLAIIIFSGVLSAA